MKLSFVTIVDIVIMINMLTFGPVAPIEIFKNVPIGNFLIVTLNLVPFIPAFV